MIDLNNVIMICQPKPQLFNIDEVNRLVPILIRITGKHENAISEAMKKQRYLIKTYAPQAAVQECDNTVGQEMAMWGAKVYKLGAKVLPQGFLGFDNGTFYWSWHYGDRICNHYHEYLEAPTKRRLVHVARLTEGKVL